MLFNSFQFFIFLPIIFILFYSIKNKYSWLVLLFASYFFYLYLKPEYIIVLIGVTLLNYYSAILISKSSNNKRKLYFYICIILNLSILIAFKYLNFIFDSLNMFFTFIGMSYKFGSVELKLPIGISFYIFVALGYTIDVYRKTFDVEKDIGRFSLFVSFFPTVLSGPIERSSRLIPQLKQKIEFNYNDVTTGIKIFIWGLFKKIVIADRLATLVNIVYDNPQKYKSIFLILATVFYAYQIYCDFSGYSDMAVGLSLMFGYKIINNFNRPYYSKSISEFWRRWHISLSGWLRDYVFLPIAYSIARRGKSGKYLFIKTENISYYIATLFTMLLIGLWHGANWNFIFWGFLFAFFLIISRITKKFRTKLIKYSKIKKYPYLLKMMRIGFTFFLICFCWIFFRAKNFNDAFYIVTNSFNDIKSIFNVDYFFNTLYEIKFTFKSFIISISSILLLEAVQLFQRKRSIIKYLSSKPVYFRWGLYLLILLIMIFLSVTAKKEFLYFKF